MYIVTALLGRFPGRIDSAGRIGTAGRIKSAGISMKFFFFTSRIGSAGRIVPTRRSGSAGEATQKCSSYILYIYIYIYRISFC